MRRFLPIVIIVIIALLFTLAGVWVFRSFSQPPPKDKEQTKQEETYKDLPIEERPYITLTPRADGRELKLEVARIPSDVVIFEYELAYQDVSGVLKGVSGSLKTEGALLTRDLLLGTCSSGVCRYDQEVEEGTLTVRLRNADKKLVSKLATNFHLQRGENRLILGDKFSFSGKFPSSVYYIVMGTFGLPADLTGKATGEPYGIFTVGSTNITGTVETEGEGPLYGWDGKRWIEIENGEADFLGTFVRASQ